MGKGVLFKCFFGHLGALPMELKVCYVLLYGIWRIVPSKAISKPKYCLQACNTAKEEKTELSSAPQNNLKAQEVQEPPPLLHPPCLSYPCPCPCPGSHSRQTGFLTPLFLSYSGDVGCFFFETVKIGRGLHDVPARQSLRHTLKYLHQVVLSSTILDNPLTVPFHAGESESHGPANWESG